MALPSRFKKMPGFHLSALCRACLLVLLPQEGHVSTGIRNISLAEAVVGSQVFVVERIDPFLKTVLLLNQPEPKDDRSTELTITYAAFLVKERLNHQNSRVLCD